jgi:hypothetical protein
LAIPILKSALISESKIEKKNAAQKPETPNPGTNNAKTMIINAFNTREKIPSVTIVSGSVSIVRIGLINTFTKANTIASTSAPINVTWTPGTKYAAIMIAIVRTSQCAIDIKIN